ncbi:MAG: F0F1 ATP synthase subunit A [Deltaproteobacteria bacterium]|nr:F0F1 ATP synthase subunit A [Deltaproteobacteria bacterium]
MLAFLPLVASLLLAQGAPAQPVPAAPSADPVKSVVDIDHGAVQHGGEGHAAEGHAAEGHAAEGHAAEHGEHEGGVAEHIFHHVMDEPNWVTPGFWAGARRIELPIGKHVVSMWIASALMLFVLAIAVSKRSIVPKGLYSGIEALVLFIRDEIAVKNIGEHDAHHYTGYLCTAFFFILFNNLYGLIPIPGVGTATGNWNVTVVLALFTFGLTQIAGMRGQGVVGYWMHIVPAGVPKWLYPLMIPVEILGLFTKPFALTVRLFANMVAGHVVIYFLIALTILLTFWIWPVSVGFALGIYMLELFVAFVQAYVFTMLSALFIGMASHAH